MMKICVFLIALVCASECSAGFQSGNKLDKEFVPYDPVLESEEYGRTNGNGIIGRLYKRGFDEASRFATQVVSDKIRQLAQSIPEMKFDVDAAGTWNVFVSNIKIDDFAMPNGIVMFPANPYYTQTINLRCDPLSISGSADIQIIVPWEWYFPFGPVIVGKIFMKTNKAVLDMSFIIPEKAELPNQPFSIDILSGPCKSSLGNLDVSFDLGGPGGKILELVLAISKDKVNSRIEEFAKPQICDKFPGFVKTLVNNNIARLPLNISTADILAKMGITHYDGTPETVIEYIRSKLNFDQMSYTNLWFGTVNSLCVNATMEIELDGNFQTVDKDWAPFHPGTMDGKQSPGYDRNDTMMAYFLIDDYTVNTLFYEMQRMNFLSIPLTPDASTPDFLREFLLANCTKNCLKSYVPALKHNGTYYGKDVSLDISTHRAPSVIYRDGGKVLFDLWMSIYFSVRNGDEYDKVGRLDIRLGIVFQINSTNNGLIVAAANTKKIRCREVEGTGLQFTQEILSAYENGGKIVVDKLMKDHLINKQIDIPMDLAEDYVDMRATSFDIIEHGLQIGADFQIKPIVASRYDEMENNTQQ